jgi:hypothetical protein
MIGLEFLLAFCLLALGCMIVMMIYFFFKQKELERKGLELERKGLELESIVKQQEIIISSITNLINPDEEENVKKASVMILSASKFRIGVGFFVSKEIVVTALHNLVTYQKINKKQKWKNVTVWAEYFLDAHGASTRTIDLELLTASDKFDLAILRCTSILRESRYLRFPKTALSGYEISRTTWAMVNFSISVSTASEVVDQRATVLPVTMIRIGVRHLIYLSTCFSGDSGSAIVMSVSGEIVGLHLETFNEVNPLKDSSYGSVIDSLNDLIAGLSTGFIGLRLDQGEVRALIDKQIKKYC